MRQTLFIIDHYLFAEHWLLIGWLLLGLAYAGYLWAVGQRQEIAGFVPLFLIVAALVHFVLPNFETMGVNPDDPNGPLVPVGLAVRGYGTMLLLALIAGIGSCLYRSRQIGLDAEKMLSLNFWMIVAGIIGARLFYVIQKFDSFSEVGGKELLFRLLDMTSGGLVVYGSLIGSMFAVGAFLAWHRMPWRRVLDVLATGMMAGVAIGRIGCLMNGCCFGGVCDDPFPGVHFPAGSPPYVHQLRTGQLFGIQSRPDETDAFGHRLKVLAVESGSIAERYGVQSGDEIQIYLSHPQNDDIQARLRAAKAGLDVSVEAIITGASGGPIVIPVSTLPDRSLQTHPTQIYSTMNAALLFLFLWFYYPWRRSDGEVFALMLVFYSIGRFLLEIVRRDEAGQFGTELTISQWISVIVLTAGLASLAWIRFQPVPKR